MQNRMWNPLRLSFPVLVLLVALRSGADPAPGAPKPGPASMSRIAVPGVVNSLPAAKTDGDLEFALTALTAGEPPPPSPAPPNPGEETWTHLKVRLNWGGRKTSAWQLQRVQVSDGEGHTWTPSKTSTHFDAKGEGEIWFSGPTWPTSMPWRVRLELARTSPFPDYRFWTIFAPDELVTLPNVSVPAPGQVAVSDAEGTVQGALVRVLGIAAAHTLIPDGLRFDQDYPSVHVLFRPQSRDVRLTFLRATDAQGNVIPRAGTAVGSHAGSEAYAYGLKIPAGLKGVYLAFAAHRSRVFEFTAHASSP